MQVDALKLPTFYYSTFILVFVQVLNYPLTRHYRYIMYHQNVIKKDFIIYMPSHRNIYIFGIAR